MTDIEKQVTDAEKQITDIEKQSDITIKLTVFILTTY